MKQLKLTFPKSKRGRPKGPFPLVRHRRRPRLDGRTPVHITWRMVRSVPNLRSQRCMGVIRRVFAEGKERLGMRLVHFAVQPDHMHLVVEPEHERALSRALQGLSIRLAKQLNRELSRGGRVFGDRFHARPLKSPQQTRRALAYVLLQGRRHAAKRGEPLPVGLDVCSSALAFDGWKGRDVRVLLDTVADPKTWLMRIGWRRAGLVDVNEVPG